MSRSNTAIDQGQFVDLHGLDQWVTIRGRDRANPALLILSGPGVAFSRMAPLFAAWERAFTLVQWDQPGAGATLVKGRGGPLTLDRLAADGLAVAEFARRRLGQERIAVLGISGGSIVGLKMIKARPELFFAYAGTGQIVHWARQEALSYARLVERMRAAGDAVALAELEALGPPPYADVASDAIKSEYAAALTPAEQAVLADPAIHAPPPARARYIAPGLPAPDVRADSLAAYSALRAEIVAFDARALGTRFEVPMLFLQGEQDAYTVTSEVEAYSGEIEAPAKALELIPGGGHSAVFLGEAFLEPLVRRLAPWNQPPSSPDMT